MSTKITLRTTVLNPWGKSFGGRIEKLFVNKCQLRTPYYKEGKEIRENKNGASRRGPDVRC